jgi:hypothetical protein
MPISEFTGAVGTQYVQIVTCDPRTRRIEGRLKDGAVVPVAIYNTPPFFRWPREGEVWSVIYMGTTPVLGSFQEMEDSSQPVEDLMPGDARIDADTVRLVGGLIVSGTSIFEGATVFEQSPTAPTPAPGTNNTQLATTAFVQAASTSNPSPPSGPAGGVLSGTYPNPGFAQDMATQAELDALDAASVKDGDAAGGVLSGTYPNPGFAVDMATQAELDAAVLASNSSLAAHEADTTNIHGIPDTAQIAYKNTENTFTALQRLSSGGRANSLYVSSDLTNNYSVEQVDITPQIIGVWRTSLTGNTFQTGLINGTGPTWVVRADGRIEWGTGSGGQGRDTNLYRRTTDQLATDDTFVILRPTATDDALFTVRSDANAFAAFVLDTDGHMHWGPGTAGTDVQLYRWNARELFIGGVGTGNTALILGRNSDDELVIGIAGTADNYATGSAIGDAVIRTEVTNSRLFLRPGQTATPIIVHSTGLRFGGTDVDLYRSTTSTLRTNASFHFLAGNTSYTADGVWAAAARPSAMGTPSAGSPIQGSRLIFGYSDDGTGSYYPSIGFAMESGTTPANSALKLLQARWTGTTPDTDNRFELRGNGTLWWGPGNAAVDTNLYRGGASILATDDDFWVKGANLRVGPTAGDYYMIVTASGTTWRGSGYPYLTMEPNANLPAGGTGSGIYFGRSNVAQDGIDLYADTAIPGLRFYTATDGDFLVVDPNTGGTGLAGIFFGPNRNVNLYRGAADRLVTDDTFQAKGEVWSGVDDQTAGFLKAFGGGPGTSEGGELILYTAADYDTTIDSISIDAFQEALRIHGGGSVRMQINLSTDLVSFPRLTSSTAALAIGGDTKLWRVGANVLQTDSSFRIERASAGDTAFVTRVAGQANNRWYMDASGSMAWGDGVTAPDTTLYRQSAREFRMTGALTTQVASETTYALRVAKDTGDADYRWRVRADGKMDWGPGSAAPDTTLYRDAVGSLATDGSFRFGAAFTGTMTTGTFTFPGTTSGPYKKRWIRNSTADASHRRLSLFNYSRDTANWMSSGGFIIEVRTGYHNGGSYTRCFIGGAYTVAPYIHVLENTGPQPIIPKLGSDVVISGTVMYREVYLEIVSFVRVVAEITYGSGILEVTGTPTAFGQVQFTGTESVLGGDPGYFSGNLDLVQGITFRQIGPSLNTGDTNIYRGGQDTLKTDDHFVGGLTADFLATGYDSATGNMTILRLRGGNSQTITGGAQIAFSFDESTNYTHRIISRHNSTGRANNALDFYLWKQGTDAATTLGTQLGLKIEDSANGPIVSNSTFSLGPAGVGFFGVTPAAQSTGWGAGLATNFPNAVSRTSLPANYTMDQMRDVLATLINVLRGYGLVGT